MRSNFWGWLVFATAVAACGETSRKPGPLLSAGAGGETAGGSAGHGEPQPGSAGEAVAGSRSDEGGAGGEAGAALEPLADHGLTLLPPLPAPTDLPPEVFDDDERTFSMDPLAVSADGSLVIALSTAIFRHVSGPVSYQHQALAYWTAASGTRPIPLPQANPNSPSFPQKFCIAEDGSSAFFADGSPATPRRWTSVAGPAPLALPEGFLGEGWASCSADGGRASFGATATGNHQRALYWQASDGEALSSVALPDAQADGSRLLLSADALGGALNIARALDSPEPSVYRWSTDGEVEALLAPDAARCRADFISGDGAVIAGWCTGQAIVSSAFRWTAASGIKLLEPNSSAEALSRDGSTLLGKQPDPTRPMYNVLFAWRAGSAAEVIDLQVDWWGMQSLSDDGMTAYLVAGDDLGSARDALKWTPDDGIVSLPKLSGLASAQLLGASRDGLVAVGLNSKPGDAVDTGVAVLWDEQGVRDIVAELVAAGVDLQGANGFFPQRVWSGSPLRIQGYCLLPDTEHKQIWFAELPVR